MDERPELWTWVAPGMQLRFRTPLDLDCGSPGSPTAVAVGAGSGLLALYDSGSGPAVEHRLGWGTVCQTVTRPDVVDVTASGPHLAVVRADPEGLVLDLLTLATASRHVRTPPIMARRSRRCTCRQRNASRCVITATSSPSTTTPGSIVALDSGTSELLLDLSLRDRAAEPRGRRCGAVRCGVGVGVGVDEPSTPLAPLSAGAMSSDPGAGMY